MTLRTPVIDLAERLRLARLNFNLLQRDVGDFCGVKRPAVSQWEATSHPTTPTPEHLELLAALYGVELKRFADLTRGLPWEPKPKGRNRPRSTLQERMRAAMDAAGLSHREVSTCIGVERSAVSQWVATGAALRTMPTWSNMVSFARCCKVSLDWLADDSVDLVTWLLGRR